MEETYFSFDLSGSKRMTIDNKLKELCAQIAELPLTERIDIINACTRQLHAISPFTNEPVGCVQWVPIERIQSNDYNPNVVAPPEMRLLEHSILHDGYTQPVVAWKREDGIYEVVDGFHRNRIGQESSKIRSRIRGYLPITTILHSREDRNDRIAATIRHNRARGKHRVEGMSDIVVELKRRNWSDTKISNELGMDSDEVLRLCQITGLAEMFADREFSEAWEANGLEINEDDSLSIEGEEITNLPLSDLGEWHSRTASKSIRMRGNSLIAQVKQNARNGTWNWYVYTAPMQTGNVLSEEDAKWQADRALMSS